MTFTVPHRDQFGGTPITSTKKMAGGTTVVSTQFYSVELTFADGHGVLPRSRSPSPTALAVLLKDVAGNIIYTTKSMAAVPGKLSGPEPATVNSSTVLAISDSPRFVPPPQGATPPASGSSPDKYSNFDVLNNAPDLYLFLASTSFAAMRAEFLKLTGPVPVLPAWAFGLWFCW